VHNLHGKYALVTGAAGGIGRAICRRLAQEGTNLLLLDTDANKLSLVIAETQSLGVQVEKHVCDLTQSQSIHDTVHRIQADWGKIDLLVNNAGVCYYGPTANMVGDDWDQVMSINLSAPIRLTQELLPMLLDQEEAHIVNVASMFGLVGYRRLVAYCTSKFAMVGFSESLRADLRRTPVGVTAICPGFVATEFFKNASCGYDNRETPTPPRWVCTSPDKIAQKTIKGIKRNKRIVVATPLAHALFNTKRYAPWLLDLLNAAGRRKKPRAIPTQDAAPQQESRATSPSQDQKKAA